MSDSIDRRLFLGLGTAAAAGFAANSILANAASGSLIVMPDELLASELNSESTLDCVLTCQQTLGPCYSANPPTRRDITAGSTGLATELAFRVVDTTCSPIMGAVVDIWHANRDGSYSALQGFCAGGSTTTPSQNFLRGIQTTDADGWAYFDTIFPGWYSGRTCHIHATVRIGTTAMVTSQFYFFDKVTRHIYRNHEQYSHRPVQNTLNTTDNILGGSMTRMMPYIMSTKYMPGKNFRAEKTIVINTTATTCNA